jgi:hypothetical protein
MCFTKRSAVFLCAGLARLSLQARRGPSLLAFRLLDVLVGYNLKHRPRRNLCLDTLLPLVVIWIFTVDDLRACRIAGEARSLHPVDSKLK